MKLFRLEYIDDRDYDTRFVDDLGTYSSRENALAELERIRSTDKAKRKVRLVPDEGDDNRNEWFEIKESILDQRPQPAPPAPPPPSPPRKSAHDLELERAEKALAAFRAAERRSKKSTGQPPSAP